MKSHKFLATLSYLARDDLRLASMAFYVSQRNDKLSAEKCIERAREMIRIGEEIRNT